MKLEHITRPTVRSLLLILLIGLFLVTMLALPLPAFAQDGTGDTKPDLSNLLTLLNYLSGPGVIIVTGLLVSRFAESWKWWSDLSRDQRVALSSVAAAIVAVSAYALGKYLLTLPVETMADIQVYFQIVFAAVAGVIGQNIFHAVINKPLSTKSVIELSAELPTPSIQPYPPGSKRTR